MFDYKGSHDRSQVEKTIRYSIRKVSFGAASVAVAALFMFLGNGAVSATEQGVPSTNEETQSSPLKDPDVQNVTYGATPVVSQLDGNSGSSETTAPKGQEETSTPTPTDVSGSSVASSSVSATEAGNKTDRSSSTPSTEEVEEKARPTLDKKQLEDYVAEIDAKLASGSYATKTDESVATLKEHLELAKLALTTATSQEELTKAYRKLLMTASSGLRNKPKAQVESPKLDTTEGKATVGKKASNTEKATGTNSIANSGQHDPRNRQALDRNNPFRTDGTTTNDDLYANQTYEAPAENADLATLTDKLKTLPNYIENNKKVQDMNTLGAEKRVTAGSVAEITEFGGWKAVKQEDGSAGKFAIARVTDKGVFPVETMNILGDRAAAYIGEQSFDRNSKYMLFLSEVRTRATKTKESFDSVAWLDNDGTFAEHTSKAVKGYNGIEKTFKVYSSDKQTNVDLNFKTGFSGHLDHKSGSTRAKYKVEVFSIDSHNVETKVYDTSFDPSVAADNDVMKVTPAKDSISIKPSFNIPKNNKEAALEEFAKDVYKPYATGGLFTAKNIILPEGARLYKVRISTADNGRLGLDYHSNYEAYALPVTGLDFNINQDTGAIAKKLLSRIYDKLKATETADVDGKTNETKAAYLAELEKVKTLVTSTDVKKTAEYKEALESTLSKQLALRVDKTGLIESKTLLDGLVNEDPTPGKTQDTATAYNAAKQEAIKAIEAAKTVIDNENATVAEVRDTLETVNAKQKALQRAKDGLIAAATADEKAKLKADSEALKKADTRGKTPNSIDAYNTKFEALKTQLEAAKTEAEKVLAKENNATKEEAKAAQAKVDAVKAELDKAVALLKDKGNTEGLEAAKNELKTATEATNVTDGKTTESADKYNEAKTAAEAVVKEAEGVIADVNSTTEDVANALTKVNAAKAVLDDAKSKLVEAATADEKAKLKADSEALKKADTRGKTPNSIDAYNTKFEALKTQLEAAKTEAEKVLAKENNATKEEAKAAQAKVDAVKAELDKAAKLLKDLDREAAKKEIADAAKTATDAIETSTSLTPEQKTEEKVKVAKEAKDATVAIDKATTEAELDKALRTFLYQMDQDSLVYERPSFDLGAFIQSSITGVVTVERGEAIRQADIIAKLNLPESITVISIDLPDTTTLGRKFAKVTLRLADGKEITVKVPVIVVASQSGESKPETSLPDYGRNNGSTNTDAKVDKAKLEGAIRQLDELIIQESAKLDAETAKEANALSADAKKVFANADTSQAEVDAMIKRIEDFMAKVALSTDHATPTNEQAAQTPAVAPTTTQAAVNAGHIASAQASVRTVAKELPNTGTVDSVVSMVVAAASALLGLGLAGRRRKEDEEA